MAWRTNSRANWLVLFGVLIAFCFLLASCGGSGDQAKKEKKEEMKEGKEKADKERANKERADREKAEQKRAAQNPPQRKPPSKSPRRSKLPPQQQVASPAATRASESRAAGKGYLGR